MVLKGDMECLGVEDPEYTTTDNLLEHISCMLYQFTMIVNNCAVSKGHLSSASRYGKGG